MRRISKNKDLPDRELSKLDSGLRDELVRQGTNLTILSHFGILFCGGIFYSLVPSMVGAPSDLGERFCISFICLYLLFLCVRTLRRQDRIKEQLSKNLKFAALEQQLLDQESRLMALEEELSEVRFLNALQENKDKEPPAPAN